MEARTSNVAESGREVGEELIAACARGERDALRALFEAASPRVHALALHFFAGDGAAAMDVTQQVFLKVLTGLPSFRGESRLSTWLHRVTINACLDHRRARRPHVPLEAVADSTADPGEGQGEAALRKERERRVRAAVAELPPKLRAAVLLRHFEDASYEDIATALGCSLGTVASRLARGHARLATALKTVPFERGEA